MFHSAYPEIPIPPVTAFELIFSREFDEESGNYFNAKDATKFLTRKAIKIGILKFGAGLKRIYQLGRDDVVAICANTHTDWIIPFHGIIVNGSKLVTIRTGEGIETAVEDIRYMNPKLIIADASTLDMVLLAAKKIGLSKSHILIFGKETLDGCRPFSEVLMNTSELATPVQYTPEELKEHPACLYFTSGTSGGKKVVTVTHHNIVSSIVNNDNWFGPGLRCLSYSSLAHGSSLLAVFHLPLYFNWKVYMSDDPAIETTCQYIQEHKIQGIVIQPWVASSLARSSLVDKYDLSSLFYVASVGSVLDPVTAELFSKRINVPLISLFGMTEALACIKYSNSKRVKGSTGCLGIGHSAKLVDETGMEVPMGAPGELCVKGPSVMPGYYNNPKETAKIFDKDGFYHTGDLFIIDEEGFFFFVSRIKDLIKYYSHYIQPSDIENILLTHPSVAECCVVGIYNRAISTEIPRAYVVTNPDTDTTKEELRDYVDQKVPSTQHLRGGVVIIDALPRSSNGKVLRRVLREQLDTGVCPDCLETSINTQQATNITNQSTSKLIL
ncbi:hypothetical protein BDF14DRAFT_1771193 [Spinellus fusiger]|nr:hypothetical protein BDF14DRAFT_1771193 [Spinellus fusiger]